MARSPIAVAGRITRCLLFTYSMPQAEAARWLPEPLEPITNNGRAFWNIVVCELAHMRPKGFPAWTGIGYRHAAYRLYARFTAEDGSEVRGLYFLRSDCDSRMMTHAGNLLTDYKFHPAPIEIAESDSSVRLAIRSADAPASAVIDRSQAARLSPGSAFSSLEEAAEFLKYEPAGIGVSGSGEVNVVRITRDEAAWKCRLVHVQEARWQLLHEVDLTPEVCYQVEPIDYVWGRARRVKVQSTTGSDGSIRPQARTDKMKS